MVDCGGRRCDGWHGAVQPRLFPKRLHVHGVQRGQLLPGRRGLARVPVPRGHVGSGRLGVHVGGVVPSVRAWLLPRGGQRSGDRQRVRRGLLLPRRGGQRGAAFVPPRLLLPPWHGIGDGEPVRRGHICAGRCKLRQRRLVRLVCRGLLHGNGKRRFNGEPVQRGHVLRPGCGVARGARVPRRLLLRSGHGRLHNSPLPRGYVQRGKRHLSGGLRIVQPGLLHCAGQLDGSVKPLPRGLLLPHLFHTSALPRGLLLPCRYVSNHLSRRRRFECVTCLRSGHLFCGRQRVRFGLVLRRLRRGLLPWHCERKRHRKPVQRGLLLRGLDAGKHGAKLVPRGLFLLRGPSFRHCKRVPRGKVFARWHNVHVFRLLPALRGRLLPRAGLHS